MDRSLTKLDISLNNLNFCGALVLEDALGDHRRLSDLNISDNPLGVIGMRSLIRLLSRDEAGLLRFNCDGCSHGPVDDPAEDDDFEQFYNASNPGGRYTLFLARPYHRALLRMLYKMAERFSIEPSVAMLSVACTVKGFAHSTKDAKGVYQVPEEGRLDMTFSIEEGLQKAFLGQDEIPFGEFVERHYSLTKLKPGFRKVVPLMAQWQSIDGNIGEQKVLLEALSQDFTVTYPQFELMAQSRVLFDETLCSLMHCIVGGNTARYLCMMLTPSLGAFLKNHKNTSALLRFNVENPTGHYCLDLENCSDHAVAERILLLDRWESGIAKRQGRVPVSQQGDYTRIRNHRHQNRQLPVARIEEWHLPSHDVFECDYISGRRPNDNVTEIDADIYDKLMIELGASGIEDIAKIEALRMVSHNMCVSAMQLREMMGFSANETIRAELFVVFILRVIDICNEKIFRVRFADAEEVGRLCM